MAQSFRTNLGNVTKHYIQQLKIAVTQTTLKENLEQNPYYPSLYSISNTFNRFNIENISFTATEENLDELQPPFITYCSGQSTGKDFVLVTAVTATQVSYLAEGNKPKNVSREDFIKQWQNVIFAAEATAQSGEKDYESKVKIEKSKATKRSLLYAGIVMLIGLLAYGLISGTNNNIAAAAITIIKLTGVAATVLLLIYEIDKTNSFVKNICTAGKQTNCDAVLNSRAGKFLGMGWGELGFFYFAATTIFLLLPGLSFINKLPWLAIASTLAAPYIVFSIYYQYKVVKQWCPLCLAVQAVLALELIWALVNFWFNNNYSLQSLLSSAEFPSPWGRIGGALLLPVVCWYFLRPLLLAAKDAPIYKAAYKRLLYNPEIFNGLLQQQATAPDGWQQLGINIGNPNAKNTILKVCNPYCGPCAKAHPVLEEIVKHNTDINVKVIFTATNSETDRAGKPVKHLLAIAAKQNLQITEQALDDWYMADKKDYEIFAAKYPMNGEIKEQESKLELMKQWCDAAEITHTPTIFINGRRLPETYSINELKNIF
ncbi:vitamin K epoxide reductase family protein [Ferruginibacter sp.]|nr:thioredoxin domain-containing protein [Ferruginibacter sp.]